MSLSDLASLGSVVSGVAVVATLIVLLMQMRRMDRNQRAAIQLGRADRQTNNLLRGSDPEMARVTAKALSGEPLTEIEVRIFSVLVLADLQGWEDTFLQRRAGLLEESSAATDEASMRAALTTAAYRAMWQFLQITFSPEFRGHVDGIMKQVAPMPTGEWAPVYNIAVREQLAHVQGSYDQSDHKTSVAQMHAAMTRGAGR